MKGRVQSRGALEGFQVALVSAALTLPRPLPGETQPRMSAPIPITLTRVGGYSGSPAWTVEGLPGAVTAAFNPSATGEPASFTLSVAQGASAGTSTLTVRATDGTLTATALLSLTLSTGNDYRLNPNVLELLDSNVTVLDVTVNTDGTGFANLTNNSYSINHPAWGPGGIIAFDAADAFGVKQVFTLNLAGGTVTQITHGATNSRHPSWSPDGTYLLYEFQTDIPSTLVARTSPAIPHSYDIIYANDTKNFLDPSYSANGRQILFRDDSYFYVTSDSGTLTYQIAMGTILLKHPVFSPDGSQIAADANPVGPPSILVMKADGTLATSIATDFYPSWRKIQ